MREWRSGATSPLIERMRQLANRIDSQRLRTRRVEIAIAMILTAIALGAAVFSLR